MVYSKKRTNSISKPKRGLRVSRKRLYKLPKKQMKGGGIFQSIGGFLGMGGEGEEKNDEVEEAAATLEGEAQPEEAKPVVVAKPEGETLTNDGSGDESDKDEEDDSDKDESDESGDDDNESALPTDSLRRVFAE